MTVQNPTFDDPLLRTAVLGRYRIVRRLAAGGMGAVYLGRTEGAAGFARPVVIKRILPAFMGDKEIAQLFIREAQILSNLQHPSIVSVLDFGQHEDGSYVMVLEYVHGYQLAEWMRYLQRTKQTMPVDFALHIVLRVLDALHYAHTYKRADGTQLRIIHRDVSPSNVLLSDSGVVKLLDFGIARVSGDETAFKTEKPSVRGKLPYLPLEMFKGVEPSEKSDLYSAGVTLFEMVAGFNPFAGRETADIFAKILNVQVPSVHASRDDAPEELDTVIARALAKDPDERYANAAELATALRGLRSTTEETITERLSERLRSDFAGPMIEVLRIEPLAEREAAWRSPESDRASKEELELDLSEPGDPTDPLSAEAFNVATVAHPIDHELLGAALRDADSLSPTSPPPDASSEATVPRRAPPAHAVSIQRIALIVTLAALVGALSAGGMWIAFESRVDDEPIVVIERESRPPAAPMPAPVPAPVAAPIPEPVPVAEPIAAAEDLPATADPLPPNPKRLTRQFGRRQKQIEACFATHAQSLQGQPQISVHFQIGTRGQVIDAALSPEPLATTSLGRCLLQVARGASFGPQQSEFAFRIPITAQRLTDEE
jgi:serine/threonine-protein kinase